MTGEELYINEPEIADRSLIYIGEDDPKDLADNIRIYVPIDLNKEAILRRLRTIIYEFGEANEDNEATFSANVAQLLYQVEIYDQIWLARHTSHTGRHSREGIDLVKCFIEVLEEIPDGCAESFPFDVIEELREEYFCMDTLHEVQ